MAGRVLVGTSSWADPGFVAEWYPQGMPARDRLGWEPRTTFPDLVRLMLEADLREAGLDPDRHLRESVVGTRSDSEPTPSRPRATI